MQENLNGNICWQFLHILPNNAQLLTWVLHCAVEGWYSNNVWSLVSLLRESNRLFSTRTKTLSSLTSIQRLNFYDRFDRSDDLFGKFVFLCSSQRWFHSWFQWYRWLSRCWWIMTWVNKNLHESYPSFIWSLKNFSSSSSIILLLWLSYLCQRNIYFLQILETKSGNSAEISKSEVRQTLQWPNSTSELVCESK